MRLRSRYPLYSRSLSISQRFLEEAANKRIVRWGRKRIEKQGPFTDPRRGREKERVSVERGTTRITTTEVRTPARLRSKYPQKQMPNAARPLPEPLSAPRPVPCSGYQHLHGAHHLLAKPRSRKPALCVACHTGPVIDCSMRETDCDPFAFPSSAPSLPFLPLFFPFSTKSRGASRVRPSVLIGLRRDVDYREKLGRDRSRGG